MKKILIAVDDTKSTKEIFGKCISVCKCMGPDQIILVYVEKFAGRSLVDEMLGDAEMTTLREVIEGTEFKEAMDKKANAILGHYQKLLQDNPPVPPVKTVIRSGHPAEEIIKTAEQEGVDLILIGSKGARASHLLMGSVSREVVGMARVPVMVIK